MLQIICYNRQIVVKCVCHASRDALSMFIPTPYITLLDVYLNHVIHKASTARMILNRKIRGRWCYEFISEYVGERRKPPANFSYDS